MWLPSWALLRGQGVFGPTFFGVDDFCENIFATFVKSLASSQTGFLQSSADLVGWNDRSRPGWSAIF